jgi:hypothetical protein
MRTIDKVNALTRIKTGLAGQSERLFDGGRLLSHVEISTRTRAKVTTNARAYAASFWDGEVTVRFAGGQASA